MANFIGRNLKLFILSAAVWATACSEIGFDPSDPDYDLLRQGATKEVFSFNKGETQARVDILFIVDNSGSMLEEQVKLGSRLDSFINSLDLVDWKIGITTTDVSDGPYGVKGSLLPLKGVNATTLTRKTPNYAKVFKDTVYREETLGCPNGGPQCPSGDERPLEALNMFIGKRNTDNKGFFRTGADFAVVVLSDEDERSNGNGAISAQSVVDVFKAAFGATKDMSAYGIIIQPGNTSCYNAQQTSGGSYGTAVNNLANLTGGVTGSICDNDYGPALESIGNRVVDLVKSITLKYMPNPDTIQLRITPFDPNLTHVIDGRVIRFNYPPNKGTRIEVLYFQEGMAPEED